MERIKVKFEELYSAIKFIESPFINKLKIEHKGTWITIKGNKFKLKSFMKMTDKTGRSRLDLIGSYEWHYLTESIGKTKHKFLADHDNFLAIVQFLDKFFNRENSKIDKNTEIEIEFSGRTRTFKINNSTLTIILSEDYPSYPANFIFEKRPKQHQCVNS
jgi:hypothetical protein